ncbi:MAG TPA: hypothetical protein VIJ25_02055 [Methylococcales bacterium]
MQAIPMKAAIGNHQILRLPIVSQRPSRDIRDWPLFGDEYDRMKFGNVLTDFKRRVGNAF